MKRSAVLLAALLALVAMTAAPAGAGSGRPAAAGPCFDEVFDSVTTMSRLGGAAPRWREPALRNGPSDSEIPGAKPKTSSSFSASIPVYFHVLHDGGLGDVSQEAIEDQMTVLNLAYDGFYGGASTGFSFTLAGVTRTDNAAWFNAEPGSPEEFAMKGALKQGDPTALNVYSTSGAQDFFLGWAYFPKIAEKKEAALDGVVLHWGSLPGGPFGSAFSLGQTATHETGHWLGLYHTFERGCHPQNDRIDDTPAQLEPTSGCPEDKDTCAAPGPDPIHNYMDYSFDLCYEEFTAGQADRMQAQYLHWRL